MASNWMHQELAIVATIDPQSSTTAGTFWFDAVDMDVFEKVAFIVQTNTVSANTTLTLTAYGDAASATGGMTVAVATSTSLTNAHDDSQIWVEVDTEDMNPDGRDRYCAAKLVVGGTGGTVDFLSGVAIAGRCRYQPASNYDLATVVQITNS